MPFQIESDRYLRSGISEFVGPITINQSNKFSSSDFKKTKKYDPLRKHYWYSILKEASTVYFIAFCYDADLSIYELERLSSFKSTERISQLVQLSPDLAAFAIDGRIKFILINGSIKKTLNPYYSYDNICFNRNPYGSIVSAEPGGGIVVLSEKGDEKLFDIPYDPIIPCYFPNGDFVTSSCFDGLARYTEHGKKLWETKINNGRYPVAINDDNQVFSSLISQGTIKRGEKRIWSATSYLLSDGGEILKSLDFGGYACAYPGSGWLVVATSLVLYRLTGDCEVDWSVDVSQLWEESEGTYRPMLRPIVDVVGNIYVSGTLGCVGFSPRGEKLWQVETGIEGRPRKLSLVGNGLLTLQSNETLVILTDSETNQTK